MAEARAIKSKIDALDNQVEIAAERYNAAADKHQKLVEERDAAAARARAAERKKNALQKKLRTRAEDMYRTGSIGIISVLLSARTYEDFVTTWDVLRAVNVKDAGTVVDLKEARAEAKAQQKIYSAKEKDAADQVRVMADNKAEIEGKLSQRKQELAGVESQIRQIEAAEEAAARARAAAAAAAAAASESSSGGGRSYPPPSIPAHGDVVDFAKSRLGCPYVWGADGPGSFDCSGLMMWAYAQIGISLPHSSAAQISSGQRVSRSDLQPGDLVFFGSPIHHVGMYVGGGMMIHAPHSGDVVKISSMDRSDYAGACRP